MYMKLMITTNFVIFTIISLVSTQINNDGKYSKALSYTTKRPFSEFDNRFRSTNRFRLPTVRPKLISKSNNNNNNNDGRYIPVDDGKYHPSDDGKYVFDGNKDRGAYSPNDGRYNPSEDGKYFHIGDKDRGLYSGGGGEYTGGGGQYTGNGDNGDSGGKYRGSGDTGGQYKGNGDTGGGQYKDRDTLKFNIIESTRKPLQSGTGTGVGRGGFRIIRLVNSVKKDGYHYLYETENGILAEESGRIENLSDNEEGLRAKGFYEYTGDDGLLYRVNYKADENGFVPDGDHIPQTPPEIKRLLAYLESKNLL